MIKERIRQLIVTLFTILHRCRALILHQSKTIHIGLLSEEFFHKDLRGFGGYGMLVKYFTDNFNQQAGDLKASVFYTTYADVPQPTVKKYHSADVILRPRDQSNYVINQFRYNKLVHDLSIDILIGIDHFGSYEYPLMSLPNMPYIIWLQDPRDEDAWRGIGTLALEVKTFKGGSLEQVIKQVRNQGESYQRVAVHARESGRKIIFIAQAKYFVDIAKRLYKNPDLKPLFLPNPITMPPEGPITFSKKPSLLFLGRLDPIKRPWIYFELAKRFPSVDFYVAGPTHFPHLIDPILKKYVDVPNLKLLGIVQGEQKTALLKEVWGMVNTSIHEALPVSFLEAFAYGKSVVSCHNPDNLTERFGVYVGDIPNVGMDEPSLAKFESAIKTILSDNFDRQTIGKQASNYVREVHSFENFQKTLLEILRNTIHNN